MSIAGVPAGGLKTVGQIVTTNALTFQADQDGLTIAVALVSSHTTGAPVVDRQGKYLGFINDFNVIWALEAGKDLSKITAEEILRFQQAGSHARPTQSKGNAPCMYWWRQMDRSMANGG
ncbi:MAG: hypothetical protein L0H94_15385 [Nitrospira sp.]|nr:hypothetical protein [Nitrospira sp.]